MTLYFAEISDKDIRATLQLLTRFAFNFGALLTMCVGPFLSFSTLNYILLVMPFTYFVVCFWIPESPYYYLKEGKVNEAKKALATLRGYNTKGKVRIHTRTERNNNVLNNNRNNRLDNLLFAFVHTGRIRIYFSFTYFMYLLGVPLEKIFQ